jgi:Co/Zn/Cd efflux system component
VLIRHRTGDANTRAVWLFSRNDALGNIAVIVAAGLVYLTGAAWPDLACAFGIAALFLGSSWAIARDALAEIAAAGGSGRLDPERGPEPPRPASIVAAPGAEAPGATAPDPTP